MRFSTDSEQIIRKIIAFFENCFLKIKPKMRDVLAKMAKCRISHTIAGRLTPMQCEYEHRLNVIDASHHYEKQRHLVRNLVAASTQHGE